MGRGNVCTHGDFEGVFFINYDNYRNAYSMLDGNGNETDEQDDCLEQFLFEEDLQTLTSLLKKRFPSFTDVKKLWVKDCRILLENELFYIGIEDNEWSAAVKLLQKSNDYMTLERERSLQKKSHARYLNGIKECLFELYDEIGTYAGAWTHGISERPMGWKSNKKLWKAA